LIERRDSVVIESLDALFGELAEREELDEQEELNGEEMPVSFLEQTGPMMKGTIGTLVYKC
jgi:hypothetical protein